MSRLLHVPMLGVCIWAVQIDLGIGLLTHQLRDVLIHGRDGGGGGVCVCDLADSLGQPTHPPKTKKSFLWGAMKF